MIPKEIREKIEYKLKLDEEIRKWTSENLSSENLYVEGFYFESMKIVDEPSGEEQDNGEYCDQSRFEYSEDSFYGYYYFPLDNGKYLCFYYEC